MLELIDFLYLELDKKPNHHARISFCNMYSYSDSLYLLKLLQYMDFDEFWEDSNQRHRYVFHQISKIEDIGPIL